MRTFRSLAAGGLAFASVATALLVNAASAAAFSVTPGGIAFGPVPVGATATDHVNLFPDPGYAVIEIDNFGPTFATVGDDCGFDSNPCTATVVFHPTATGDFTGQTGYGECLMTDTQNCRSVVIDLTGTGVNVGIGSATVSPTDVAPGGQVTVTSVTACPAGAQSAWVAVDAQDGTRQLNIQAPYTDAADHWAVTFNAPTVNGAYTVTSYCRNYDLIVENYTPLSLTVGTTTTTVSAAPNPVDFGQSAMVRATVAFGSTDSSPTGSVTFSVDGSPLTTVALVNGVATWTESNLAIGTHHIVATYSGNGATSSGAIDLIVQRAATALVALPTRRTTSGTTFSAVLTSDNAPLPGMPVTFSAKSLLGTWPVQCTATTNAQGVATCHTANRLFVGFANTYRAAFAGTAQYQPATAAAKFGY